MGRNRFVEGRPVRIHLVDVARHQLHTLEQLPAPKAEEEAARMKALADAALNVSDAEADGAWIDVKSELTAGEAAEVYTDLVTDARHGEAFQIDVRKLGITRLLKYLLAWSFAKPLPDGREEPVPISAGSLWQLDSETFRELNDAIDWHEETIIAAREARKNIRGSGTESKAISPSPSAAAGA
jgi:hypothetical protein